DLFELPCMAAMDERLQEKKPVRKDLFNLVRMAWWLPQYRDASTEEFISDVKDLFSRWPWYDDEVTGYQIRYELDNDIGGEIPLPMNCANDDMQRYCIGRDQCPYSIYGSLPFPDEMYEQIDDQGASPSQ
ncbi:primase-associated protein, partial [Haladaptatus sp. NG-SE-30]